LAGDFNVPLNDFLIEYIRSGSADLTQMPLGRKKRAVRVSDSAMRAFKAQTQALRGVLTPSSSVSKAYKLKAVEKPSEVKKPSEAEQLSAMIKA
ncbi:hypothetical protein BGZ72_003962, partial [Mortierella alpina]